MQSFRHAVIVADWRWEPHHVLFSQVYPKLVRLATANRYATFERELINFEAAVRSGDQLRGPCSVHCSASLQSMSFSVNLSNGRYQCFKCGSTGGQLELWASVQGISVYQAALDLCEQFGVEVPWIRRW